MPRFSIVTTCKGRLDDLKQVIDRMYNQADAELVVVDYNCPQGTAQYVRRNFPKAIVVHESQARDFCLSKARNLGAAAATGEILIFLDADVQISEKFCSAIGDDFQAGSFGLFPVIKDRTKGIEGSCVVPKAAWNEVSGYDEVIRGYGGDDKDFYFRLQLAGHSKKILPAELIDHVIPNKKESKTEFYELKDRVMNVLMVSAYRQLKNIMLLLTKKHELDLPGREIIMKAVRSSFANRSPFQRKLAITLRIPNDGTVVKFANGTTFNRIIGVEIDFPHER